MDERPHTVKVTIFGTEYPIKGDADPTYVNKLAKYVDSKMLDLTGGSTSSATVRLAVMAALNVADELFQARENLERLDGDRTQIEAVEQKIADLTNILGDALAN